MTLLGEYTKKGAALAPLFLSGQLQLTITRCTAGGGSTSYLDDTLDDPRQELAVYDYSLDGDTLSIPVRLVAANADARYILKEVGLYAQNMAGEEILYKIYRFDTPVTVDPANPLTATLNLCEKVAPGSSLPVAVFPDGMLTRQEAGDIICGYFTYDPTQSQNIPVTGPNLQSAINALPNVLLGDVKITVTGGDYTGNLIVQDFQGPGSLTIISSSKANISGYVLLERCKLASFLFDNFQIGAAATLPTKVRSCGNAAFIVKDCINTRIERVAITAPSAATGVGFFAQRSQCSFASVEAKKRRYFILSYMFSNTVLRSAVSQGGAGCTYLVGADMGSMHTGYLTDSEASSMIGCSSFTYGDASTVSYSSNNYTSTAGSTFS